MKEEIEILPLLKSHWGYDAFRPKQEEAIYAAIHHEDSLVLFPTGGGKSLCYQLTAIALEGLCVVISPLVALMQDQVSQLRQRGIKADYLHAGLSYFEIDRLLDNAIYGDTKLLYLAPERLKHPLTLERLRQMKVNLIAVDEAHCISQWGHDFRPAYREIVSIRELLPQAPLMALTATATGPVKKDIINQLGLRNVTIVEKSFERENLHFVVRVEEDKTNQIVHIISHIEGSVIIYARSRKKTSDIARVLSEKGFSAVAYHAGMGHKDRQSIMQDWMKGRFRIVCATNAFGMGVDKSDVRAVIHVDLPPSLEEYYQEAGRAGRDGKKAYCLILYNQADLLMMESKLKLSFPSIKDIYQCYSSLGKYFNLATGSGEGESFDFDFQSFIDRYNLSFQMTTNILKILEQSGWITLTDSFYRPSKVMLVADKMLLYDYQLKHKSAALFIKALLRTYEGLYAQFTPISEKFLAGLLKTSKMIVEQMLEQLQADEIIDYEAESDAAKVTFLLPRSTKLNFAIDEKLFLFRKERMNAHHQQVKKFINSITCRMQILLKYFGESSNTNCGKCDICTKKDSQPDEATFARFKAIILKHIDGDISVKEVKGLFPSNRTAQVFYVLERMVDENWITIKNERIYLHPSKRSDS